MKEKINVTTRVGESESKYEFTEIWQVVWFLKIANATIRFFDWIYGVKR